MDPHLITSGAAAFGTLASLALAIVVTRRFVAGRAPRFRFAEILVWITLAIGFLLAWFPGFLFGGHFGGAVMAALAGLVGLPPAIPVALGIAVGVTVALTALALILPLLAAYMLLRDRAA
ncbi:hypothetical protein [Phenylobacterium sp.]|uniref:hypothetical protein n=1 Tax=Phenylobacterium sp. TaxID=1871053 RepID=UPI0035B1F148